MIQIPLRLPLLLSLVFFAVAPHRNVHAQDAEELQDALIRIFEVDSAAFEAVKADSIRILAEIQREGSRITPVSYPTRSQQKCRAAAVMVFTMALYVVEQRGWTDDLEIDVTCEGFRTTAVFDYSGSITLTDRSLPDGTVLYTKTHSRTPIFFAERQ